MHDNLRKAALLLASIPESDAAALIGRLNDPQIEAIALAVASLKGVSKEQQQQVAAELVDARYRRRGKKSACEPRPEHCGFWEPSAQRELEQLQQAPAHWLADELAGELPQTIAVVLCHIHPRMAAETLAALTTETQLRVVQRIADYEQIPQVVVSEIIAMLSGRLRFGRLADINNSGGLSFVAQVVSRMDHATERALLENLSQDDRPMVDQLLQLMSLLRDRKRTRNASGPTQATDKGGILDDEATDTRAA